MYIWTQNVTLPTNADLSDRLHVDTTRSLLGALAPPAIANTRRIRALCSAGSGDSLDNESVDTSAEVTLVIRPQINDEFS